MLCCVLCSRGSALCNLLRVDLLCRIAVGGDLPPPPPLLRPASPKRFVISLLGLRRRQLAPDLSSAQFILSATKSTDLASARKLYNSHGLWAGVEVLFALVWGSAPKASSC